MGTISGILSNHYWQEIEGLLILGSPFFMITVQDPLGNLISLPAPAKRVVSLVPSLTELVIDMVGADKIVGRTKFCVHPKNQVKHIPIVGGTKQVHFNKIDELQPDLIITNKEENTREIIETLQEKYPVWVSDIVSIEDQYAMIHQLGSLLGAKNAADEILRQVRASLDSVFGKFKGKVLYLIWKGPYMAAGKGTFIHSMINFLGFQNVVLQRRYPELDEYIIREYKPDYVFLSSEPFPFKEKHKGDLQAIFPNAKISLVDGELFSWYGSRLKKAQHYFNSVFSKSLNLLK